MADMGSHTPVMEDTGRAIPALASPYPVWVILMIFVTYEMSQEFSTVSLDITWIWFSA